MCWHTTVEIEAGFCKSNVRNNNLCGDRDFRCIQLLFHNFKLSVGLSLCSFEAVDGVPRVSPQVGRTLPKQQLSAAVSVNL